QWDAAHAGLRHRRLTRPARTPDAEARYLLRGMLRCSYCGGGLASQWSGRWRYYGCLRHQRFRAAAYHHSVCPLPDIPAEPLEAEVRAMITEALLNPDYLAAGLAGAQAEHAQAAALREEQVAVLDRELQRLRARLTRIMAECLDAEVGSETARALRGLADETEAALRRLSAERAKLAAAVAPGLSPAEAQDLLSFAAEVRAGIVHARADDWRTICQHLHLQGHVRDDAENGTLFGRRYRFTIRWEAVLELPHSKQNVSTVWLDARSGS